VLWKVHSKAPTVTASMLGTVLAAGEGYTTIRDSTPLWPFRGEPPGPQRPAHPLAERLYRSLVAGVPGLLPRAAPTPRVLHHHLPNADNDAPGPHGEAVPVAR